MWLPWWMLGGNGHALVDQARAHMLLQAMLRTAGVPHVFTTSTMLEDVVHPSTHGEDLGLGVASGEGVSPTTPSPGSSSGGQATPRIFMQVGIYG